jgi:hypothetical protein
LAQRPFSGHISQHHGKEFDMTTNTATQSYRIRRTALDWRIPKTRRVIDAPVQRARSPIGTAYAKSAPAASPAKALLGAFLASITLFVAVGALALPAAAFA